MRALNTNEYFADSYNFICIWHINQNILKKWKLYIGASIDEAENQRVSAQKEFHGEVARVWQAPTEAQFLKEWQCFIAKYRGRGEDGIRLANYITNTWYIVREQFATAWSNNHRHYGNIATSRAEGAHAMLKKYIQVSTGNLFSTVVKIMGAIDAQYLLYIESRDRDREHAYVHQKSDPFFAAVIHRIPRNILQQVSTQMDLYKIRITKGTTTPANDAHSCSGIFTRTMGIPCSHIISRRLQREDISQRTLTIDDFSKQWWISQPSTITPVDAVANDDASGYKDVLQQERARLIALAISRIENASPAQLTVVNEQLVRPIGRIFNPATVRGKGRPRGALGKQVTPSSSSSSSSSTRRISSHFEQCMLNGVDNQPPPSSVLSIAPSVQWDAPGSTLPPSSQRLCSKCRRSGHNARTCDAIVIG